MKIVSLLKDASGNYMVSPNDGYFYPRENKVCTVKFPAPSAESETIILNVPNYGDIDIPVSR